MPKLTLETHDREKPIILVAGTNVLINVWLEKTKEEFKIALISDDENVKAATVQNDSFYRIRTDSAYLIKNLEEKIDYAVIFLENSEQRKYLPHVFEKASLDKTKTLVIISVQDSEKFTDVILEYKQDPNIYFAFLGDLYSEKEKRAANIDISSIIYQAIKDKTIIINGSDQTPIFPIYYEDALTAINTILLGDIKSQKFYYLFYSRPQTIVSATHILKRVEPDLEIKYEDEKKQTAQRLPYEEVENLLKSKLLTTPIYLDKYFIGFEKSIDFFVNYKLTPVEEKIVVEKIKKISPKKQSHFFRNSFISALLIYVFLCFIFLVLGVINFKSGVAAFKNDNFENASQDIRYAKIFLDAVSPNVKLVGKGLEKLNIKEVNSLFNNFEKASGLLAIAANDLETLNSLPAGIDKPQLEELISDAQYLYFVSQKLRATAPNNNLNVLSAPEITKALSLSQVSDKLLGFDREKNYVLLFQNNGELRPTGGFIGSIGELKVSKGKVVSFEIKDVYDLDGKLKSHIEPHYIIRRFLQPHLYLRDSNFDLNFQKSANSAATLYKLESGNKVDGVIAINYDAVKEIIKILGPIKLPGYNKTIDENNAFEFLESTIDDNFFPGSTQKKDVLKTLFNQITLKLESDKNNFIKVARILPKLAEEKNVLFAFGENSTQAIFSAEGFGGDYRDLRIVNDKTIPDFFSINEANIGVNKANIHINRSISYNVTLSDTTIDSDATITLTNTSLDMDYNSYVRIVTPLGSRLKAIKIDGVEQKIVSAVTDFALYENINFKAPSGIEIDTTQEFDKQIFGFRTILPRDKKQIIAVEFENGVKNTSASLFNYSLLVVKQPGVASLPFDLTVNYPKNYSPQEVEGGQLSDGSIKTSKNITKDTLFEIKFIKK